MTRHARSLQESADRADRHLAKYASVQTARVPAPTRKAVPLGEAH